MGASIDPTERRSIRRFGGSGWKPWENARPENPFSTNLFEAE